MMPTEPPMPPPNATPVPGAAAPAPTGGPSRGRVIGAALVGLAVAAVVALVAFQLGPDDTVEAVAPPSTTTPPETLPSTTAPDASTTTAPDASTTTVPDTTTPGGEDAQIQAMVDELMAFVEDERGLEFLERPEVVVLEGDAFVERYQQVIAEDLAEEAETVAHFTGIYQALTILPEGVTIEDAYAAFGDGAVGGYYDTETGELVVRGGEVTPFVRVVVAHELVHALDDQHFELYRPEYDDRDDEIGFGLTSVVEGNARRIENSYRAGLSAAEQQQVTEEEMAMSAGIDLSMLSYTFIQLQLLPYDAGEQLVGEILDAEGQPRLDAAFVEPPTTSEQVLDPDRFLAGEPAEEVAPPPADGEVQEDGLFGQGVLWVLLADVIGERNAAEAVTGWAGDWFVSWASGADTCVRVDVRMDDGSATDRLEDALGEWLAGDADGDLQRTADDTVRLTACG